MKHDFFSLKHANQLFYWFLFKPQFKNTRPLKWIETFQKTFKIQMDELNNFLFSKNNKRISQKVYQLLIWRPDET